MSQNYEVPHFEGGKFATPEENLDAHLNFVVALRKRVFYSEGEAANYFGRSRSTIQRYENGQIRKVPTGYLAELALLFCHNERIGADGVAEIRAQLLQKINSFLKWSPYYRGEQLFFEWADLEACAIGYLPDKKVETPAEPEPIATATEPPLIEPIVEIAPPPFVTPPPPANPAIPGSF